MNFFKGNFKFIIILLLIFFGGAIINIVDNFDYNENKTGIIYQENENVVLSELNRSYDYDLDYNLSQSYLQYVPVKKNGILDNYNNQGKNLGSPDLTDKQYLGNGEYLLFNDSGLNVKYNIYNGTFIFNGIVNADHTNYIIPETILQIETTYTVSFYAISGSTIPDNVISYVGYTRQGIRYEIANAFGNLNNATYITKTSLLHNNGFRFDVKAGDIFNNAIVKLQIEKGTTATAYEVPYIPAMKIDFKGTNQVEYINPYEEQIIKINDINNVNNIEFDLLNTINPVVFNWNITTNPDIPFVKFYNNKTKLLYDFTDINEINNIGNELMGSRSNFSVVFGGVFELIDMFYSGFQKLFNNSVTSHIFDTLKTLPSIVGNWFWYRGGIN